MKKLAITGITGKNGRILFEHLINNEQSVLERWSGIKVLVRDPKRAAFIRNADTQIHFEMVEGDLGVYDTSEKLLDGCDTVLHIAGIQKSVNIIQAAVKCGVERAILVHTAGIYSKYKAAGEEYIRIEQEAKKIADEHGIVTTILRPTMIFGTLADHNMSVFIKMVAQHRWVPVINGAHYDLQPVHCADLGKAFYQILTAPEMCDGQEYILSGEKPIELRAVLELIAQDMGVKRRFFNVPFGLAYAGARMLYWLSGKKKDYREKVQRLCEPRAYSHQKAADDFGYEPMPFEEGLAREVEAYLKSAKKQEGKTSANQKS